MLKMFEENVGVLCYLGLFDRFYHRILRGIDMSSCRVLKGSMCPRSGKDWSIRVNLKKTDA